MRYPLLFLAFLFCQGCDKLGSPESIDQSTSCRGVYLKRDEYGLHKYDEASSARGCLTNSLPLSTWEASSERKAKQGSPCVPQLGFSPRSLISANNFYSYRNGRIYLDLDSSTGEYRRITLGEGSTGKPLYTKLQGCFWQRTGDGVDIAFGKQLLLDTQIENIASTDIFNPMEIFRYDETPTELTSTRFDRSDDWDFRFCPYLSTPWEFCTLIRDGNILFWPVLTAAEAASTFQEALLIRKQFNYTAVNRAQFEKLWGVPGPGKEVDRVDFKYDVTGNVDTPALIDAAWRDYMIGERPVMPNVNSNQMPPICYPGTRQVVLTGGGIGYVLGEVCYVGGAYEFTPQP